jgi:HSP20 family molecular chaperone IbpA
MESGAYPGAAPSFFPYKQYPSFTWQPRVDIFEDHDSFLVIVEVPGANPEQLNVENTSNLLLISGQSLPVMSGGENMTPCYQERVCGGFTRSVPLPPHADCDQAEATCKNGLLEIRVPKKVSFGHAASAAGEELPTVNKTPKKRASSGRPGVKH